MSTARPGVAAPDVVRRSVVVVVVVVVLRTVAPVPRPRGGARVAGRRQVVGPLPGPVAIRATSRGERQQRAHEPAGQRARDPAHDRRTADPRRPRQDDASPAAGGGGQRSHRDGTIADDHDRRGGRPLERGQAVGVGPQDEHVDVVGDPEVGDGGVDGGVVQRQVVGRGQGPHHPSVRHRVERRGTRPQIGSRERVRRDGRGPVGEQQPVPGDQQRRPAAPGDQTGQRQGDRGRPDTPGGAPEADHGRARPTFQRCSGRPGHGGDELVAGAGPRHDPGGTQPQRRIGRGPGRVVGGHEQHGGRAVPRSGVHVGEPDGRWHQGRGGFVDRLPPERPFDVTSDGVREPTADGDRDREGRLGADPRGEGGVRAELAVTGRRRHLDGRRTVGCDGVEVPPVRARGGHGQVGRRDHGDLLGSGDGRTVRASAVTAAADRDRSVESLPGPTGGGACAVAPGRRPPRRPRRTLRARAGHEIRVAHVARRRRDEDPFAGFADVREIGRGSFATVLHATDLTSGQPVAIKVLHASGPRRADEVKLHLEGRALAAVSDHPNVVTLHRVGVRADGHPMLVLELCEGSFADRLADEGPLEVPEVLSIGVKLAGALETAHRAGVLHRDLKPSNVLVTAYGEPALADFGIAELRTHTSGGSSRSGLTVHHASPEVLLGRDATVASDVYGLASVLYELLVGHAPFFVTRGEAAADVQRRIIVDPPPRLEAPGATTALRDLLRRALAKDPRQRPPSALAFAQELRDLEVAGGWPATVCRVEGVAALPPPPPRPRPATTRDPDAAGPQLGALSRGFGEVADGGGELTPARTADTDRWLPGRTGDFAEPTRPGAAPRPAPQTTPPTAPPSRPTTPPPAPPPSSPSAPPPASPPPPVPPPGAGPSRP
ncbi:protein kinase [Nitriliruptoraceae bacterium ZYF776]|nr:protein kinase [Profundirhabdus halotolerans]